MPNWCNNRITIDGPAADLGAFMEAVTNPEGKISVLDSLVPRPEGIENWYEWAIDNWGTKWPDDMMLANAPDDSEEIILIGDTAWSPPLEGYRQVSALYPSLCFTMTYDEPGMGFVGAAIIKDGNLLGSHEIGNEDYPECEDFEDAEKFDAYLDAVDACRDECLTIASKLATKENN